ncbi:hypothetical protein BGX30_000348 [Mortierella sp. GBA39]|nr:hypothetical protein BGX30_000348 [Mortierella sp. GBA39]
MVVNRLERRLLVQMLDLFSDIRHRYHQHGMVDEALQEAAESAEDEAGLHTRKIAEALISNNPSEELEKYYEAAPNRFLKAIAGISYMIMAFGDKVKEQGSIYLQGLSGLTKEIHLEILRRSKLDYLLKGLNVIALVPLFFTKPIERWARSSFPAMDEFYMSKLGYAAKILIYIVIILSFVLLQKLQQNDETTYRAGRNSRPWEKAISRVPLFRMSRHHIMFDPVVQDSFFGQTTITQQEEGKRLSSRDLEVMRRVNMSPEATYAEIAEQLQQADSKGLGKDELVDSANRILGKLQANHNEYFKWWELVLCLFAGMLGYEWPFWLLLFQRKLRYMDMRHEVYQYQTVISMLREMDRISVEEILEWMDRFAVIFKIPIQKCLIHYDHGGEMALQQLKEEVRFTEFQRIVDKLLLSVEKIPISQAFDDLEGEMSFYFEQRKQDYERIIDTKAGLGRLIGFAPIALKVAAGIFLTIALITIVVILFISAQEATKTAQNNFSDIQTELSQASFTVYDGTSISGSQVTNALRKFKDKDQFGILVKTGKNRQGQWYGNQLNISADIASDNYGSVINTGQRVGNLTQTANESSNEYVNPSGKFKASIVKDSSNVVRGLIFEQ